VIERYKTVGADSISALEPKMIHEPKKINEPKIVYKFQRAEMDSQRAEMDSQRAEMDSQRAEMDSAPTYKHNRQSLRLKHYDYSREGYYFITIVAQNREHLFGEIVDGVMGLSVAGEMVEELWHDIPHDFKHVKLHEFIIMPNHIHGIIEIIKPYDTDIKPVGAESISALNMNTKKIHEFQRVDMESNARVDMESTPTLNNMDTQRADMESAPTLSTIMQSFKRHTTLRYIKMVKNNTLPPFNKRIWQRNYYEHIIRDENDYTRIAEYIINNPITWNDDVLSKNEYP